VERTPPGFPATPKQAERRALFEARSINDEEKYMQVIRNDFESSRFIAYVDGEVAASLEYRIQDGQMWLLGVDASGDHRDPQLKSRLVREALTEAGRRRLSVLPFCPEARSQVLAHPVFFRLVPHDQRQRLNNYATRARKHSFASVRRMTTSKDRHLAAVRPKEESDAA
jgi:uncharacterized protein